jgi:hypothetical protein
MKLCTCLSNPREEHMMMQPDESDDESEGHEDDSSGSEDESDSGSEHDSGEGKAAAGSGSEDGEEAAANGHTAEGGGSHGGDDKHTHKGSKKVCAQAARLCLICCSVGMCVCVC